MIAKASFQLESQISQFKRKHQDHTITIILFLHWDYKKDVLKNHNYYYIFLITRAVTELLKTKRVF